MANKKSAKKRTLTNEKSRKINVSRRSEVRSATRKVFAALAEPNLDISVVKELLREAESKIAKAKGKGVIKSNAAARKISRLTKKVTTAENK